MTSEDAAASANDSAAAVRRERRRQRILANSDERMKRILTDGDDVRQAPAMEGGDAFKFSFLSENQQPAGNGEASDIKTPLLEHLGIQRQVASSFIAFDDVTRFMVVCVLGILFFAMHTFALISNILLLWTLVFSAYTAFEYFQRRPRYSKNGGYLMNTLMCFGVAEQHVNTLGFLYETASSFARHSASLAFVFISCHLCRSLALSAHRWLTTEQDSGEF